MTHKNAPPLSPEQERFESWYAATLNAACMTCGLGRDAKGEYFAQAARMAWQGWQAAQVPIIQRGALPWVSVRVNDPEEYQRYLDKIAALEAAEASLVRKPPAP